MLRWAARACQAARSRCETVEVARGLAGSRGNADPYRGPTAEKRLRGLVGTELSGGTPVLGSPKFQEEAVLSLSP